MRIDVNNGYGTTYIFEVVEKMPKNFEVWNIPQIGNGEYIPICEAGKPDKVNIATLKCIRLSEEEVFILHKAAGCGVKTVKSAKVALNRTAKSAFMKRKQILAEKALPILEKITA